VYVLVTTDTQFRDVTAPYLYYGIIFSPFVFGIRNIMHNMMHKQILTCISRYRALQIIFGKANQ